MEARSNGKWERARGLAHRALGALLVSGCAAVPPGPSSPAGVSTASRMRGQYTYMADAGWFVDCADGRRLPVAQEGDNAALEAAYSKSRPSPGAAMLATVDARVAMRPAEDGGRERPALIVERFVAISADARCETPAAPAKLEGTTWKLAALRGRPVEVAERQPEPHLVLLPEQQRIAGSGGCNRIVGGYKLDGDRLTFGRAAATLMACPQGMEQERAFLDTLSSAARWRIDGQRMELLDEAGVVLAQFVAAPAPR
jgi:copper homeostasis protein (lipoprotein)